MRNLLPSMLYLWKQVFGCISCYFDVRTNSACLLKHSHPWGIPYPSVRLWLKSLYVHIHIGESIPGNSKAKGTNANVSFLFQHNFFFIAKLIREKHLNLLSCYHMEPFEGYVVIWGLITWLVRNWVE